MLFERGDTKHKIIFCIFFIYFLFHHLSFRKRKVAYSCLPSKVILNFKLFIIFIQRMVSRTVILFRTKCFLFVYTHTHTHTYILKLKAYKLLENSDADLSWLLFFFKEANLFSIMLGLTFSLYKQSRPSESRVISYFLKWLESDKLFQIILKHCSYHNLCTLYHVDNCCF